MFASTITEEHPHVEQVKCFGDIGDINVHVHCAGALLELSTLRLGVQTCTRQLVHCITQRQVTAPPELLCGGRDVRSRRTVVLIVLWCITDSPMVHHRCSHSASLMCAGLLVFDPLVEELRHGDSVRAMPERTARSRYVRAVGLSRRDLHVIERARHAAGLLTSGASIAHVIRDAGYYDQPHLTRSLRRLIGHTPAQLKQGGRFLDL